MSQSPTDERGARLDGYHRGWEALFTMLYAGGSLSGRERNCCFLNRGSLPFADISAVAGIDFPDDGRAVGVTDWDHDGRLDLWFVNRTAPRARFMRNVAPTENHYVAFQLEGVAGNRDAIGARVELRLADDDGGFRRIKTLRAGEGYLAQSSKWLHFGLGDDAEIEKLIVRWPGGEVEQFTGLEVDQRYRVVQGSGQAQPWLTQARDVRLEPSRLDVPPISEAARIVLAGRIPMLGLEYRQFNEASRQLDIGGGPLLVNLWASWCGPCIGELTEFADHEAQLREHGLNILALSVDEPGDRSKARAMLDDLGWTFDSGYAPAQMLDVLDAMLRGLLSQKRRMPVPTSFLIDGRGRLAAVYKGAIDVEVLLADLDRLETDSEQLQQDALPFAGRWHAEPSVVGHSELAVANQLIKIGYTDQGRAYLSLLTDGIDIANIPEGAEARASLAGAELNLGVKLSKQGRGAEAIAALRRALELRPDYDKAHYNLGIALQDAGDLNGALEHFTRAVELDPSNAEAHFNLGYIRAAQGDADKAIDHYRQAIRARPDFMEAHLSLGSLLLQNRDFSQASRHLRRAVELAPDHAEARYGLANAALLDQRYEEAVREYERALRIRPDYIEAHTNLASAMLALDCADEAVEHLSRVVDATPDDAKAHYNLGAVLLRIGRLDQAIEQFRTAIKLRPDYVAAMNGLAKVLATRPNARPAQVNEAVRIAKGAVELTGGKDIGVLDTLAAAYAAAGDWDRAIATTRRAVDLAAQTQPALIEPLRRRLDAYRRQQLAPTP